MSKAIEIWNSLDLSNQTNLECARAWFMEGFAHGQKVKTLTYEEIIECWNETHPAVVMLNAELPLFARAILKKASEK